VDYLVRICGSKGRRKWDYKERKWDFSLIWKILTSIWNWKVSQLLDFLGGGNWNPRLDFFTDEAKWSGYKLVFSSELFFGRNLYGKSSKLNLLPVLLSTSISTFNFQRRTTNFTVLIYTIQLNRTFKDFDGEKKRDSWEGIITTKLFLKFQWNAIVLTVTSILL